MQWIPLDAMYAPSEQMFGAEHYIDPAEPQNRLVDTSDPSLTW